VARLLLEFMRVWVRMLKKDYKAHVAANQHDLNSLPACGARTRSEGLCKHKGIFVMVDVNATVESYRANNPDLWTESSPLCSWP
jgi:hypothetical protein